MASKRSDLAYLLNGELDFHVGLRVPKWVLRGPKLGVWVVTLRASRFVRRDVFAICFLCSAFHVSGFVPHGLRFMLRVLCYAFSVSCFAFQVFRSAYFRMHFACFAFRVSGSMLHALRFMFRDVRFFDFHCRRREESLVELVLNDFFFRGRRQWPQAK